MLVAAPFSDGSFRLVAEVDDAPEQPDVARCAGAPALTARLPDL
jgi:hypothetical protein